MYFFVRQRIYHIKCYNMSSIKDLIAATSEVPSSSVNVPTEAETDEKAKLQVRTWWVNEKAFDFS